jgi:glucosamine--fructose-6-phosphate aminotransferase (isomerizing)
MSAKDNNTYKEISSQIISWNSIYNDIVEDNSVNIEIFRKKYDKIIFCGCGSSYNLSQSAAFFTKSIFIDIEVVAAPSSEILLNPDLFVNSKGQFLIIGFSRSGETTEILEVFKKFSKDDNISKFAFSCNDKSSIVQLSDNYYVCKKAGEKSIVMTVSFSSMLFAYCLIVSTVFNKAILNDFKELISYMNRNFSNIDKWIENYGAKNNFYNYFVLGSEFNYGIAVEADLKMKEMSQIPSYAYHIYEFIHGPKSLVTGNTLSMVLTLSKNIFKKDYIMKELKDLNSQIIVIGPDFRTFC